jgi:hypothetical protein
MPADVVEEVVFAVAEAHHDAVLLVRYCCGCVGGVSYVDCVN